MKCKWPYTFHSQLVVELIFKLGVVGSIWGIPELAADTKEKGFLTLISVLSPPQHQ